MATYHTGRHCRHCDALLTVRDGEIARDFNRRNYCNKLCARRSRPIKPIVHGTVRGYGRCYKQPGGPCDECGRAKRDHSQTRRQTDLYKQRERARYRAFRELAVRYPDEFQALLEKELSA